MKKSSARLRVECLERRNLLSAIGLPLLSSVAPPALPPAPAATANVYQVGADPVALAVIQDAVQNAAAPIANPAFTLDLLLSPARGDSSNAAVMPDANPIFTPDRSAVGLGHSSDGSWSAPAMASQQSLLVTLTILTWTPQGFLGEVAPDALSTAEPGGSPSGMNGAQPVVASVQPNSVPAVPTPAGFRAPANHPADQALPPNVANDPAPGVEFSPLPVKGNVPNSVVACTGDQAATAVDTSLSPSITAATLPATNAALSNAATPNAIEDGFITVTAAPATTSQPADTPSYNTGLQGVGGAGLGGNGLTSLLPGTGKFTDSGKGSSRVVTARESLAGEVSSHPSVVILQSAADAESGEGIELAIGAPATTAADNNSPAAGESSARPPQPLSEIRPESEIGLFCDIEVAVGPTLPAGGSASAATIDQNAGPVVADTGGHGSKAGAPAALVTPLTTSSQSVAAAPANTLPLLLSITVLVSWGGLRLEEKASARERHLRNVRDHA